VGRRIRKRREKTADTRSSNVLFWRSLRVYSGRSCRTETTAGANRIRLRKRVRAREKEFKQTKGKDEIKQMASKKKKISFPSSINLTPFWPLLILLHALYYVWFSSSSFQTQKMNRRRSSSSNMSRALQSREHTHTHYRVFPVVLVVVASCRFPVWKRTTDKRVGYWEKEWLYDDDERLCHEKPDRFLKVDVIIIPYWTMRHTSNVLPWSPPHPYTEFERSLCQGPAVDIQQKNGEKKIWKRKSVGFRQKKK
jgi:hypothetical protein